MFTKSFLIKSKIKTKPHKRTTKHSFHGNEVNSHCYPTAKRWGAGGKSFISKVLLKINSLLQFHIHIETMAILILFCRICSSYVLYVLNSHFEARSRRGRRFDFSEGGTLCKDLLSPLSPPVCSAPSSPPSILAYPNSLQMLTGWGISSCLVEGSCFFKKKCGS